MIARVESLVSQAVPDLEGASLLGQFPEGLRLVGTRCNTCGRSMLDARIVCSNCVSRDVSRVALSTEGTLYSFTRLHVGADGIRPIGYVDLDDGVRTLADLRETTPLRPGMRVEFGTVGDTWFFAAPANEER